MQPPAITPARPPARPVALNYLLSTHPLPSVAVTAFVTAVGVAAGVGAGRLAALAAAVLVGQFSVGWANDAIDAERDRLVDRQDKPVARGDVRRGAVLLAAKTALVADVPLSLAIGWRAGAAHLIAVGWAWLYDAGLKATWASVVPYMISFGLVPVVVAAALPGAPAAQPLLVVAAAWCGVAAHFANTVGDAADDARFGIRGLPQRVGEPTSVLIAAIGVAAAATALLVAVGVSVLAVTACGASIGFSTATVGALRSMAGRRLAFRLVLIAVALLIVAFVGAGGGHLRS